MNKFQKDIPVAQTTQDASFGLIFVADSFYSLSLRCVLVRLQPVLTI